MEYNPLASNDLHRIFQDAENYTSKALMDIWLSTSPEAAEAVAQKAVNELQQMRLALISDKKDLFNPVLTAADHIISRAAAEKGR